jgi:hypothetical protein
MKTIEQNNRMIAEFMGGKFHGQSLVEINKNEVWLPIHGICRLDLNGKKLNYHSSWDWLMPVVEKIENLEYINREGRFNLGSVNFEENYTAYVIDNGVGLIQEEGETKLHATYQAVVQFIEWYNEQK